MPPRAHSTSGSTHGTEAPSLGWAAYACLVITCTYCGEPADTLDHVVPRSYLPPGVSVVTYNRKYVVPACAECNCCLSNKAYHTVGSRAGYLAKRYARRYRAELLQVPWTDDELSELDMRLRQYVRTHLNMKTVALERIARCLHTCDLSPTIDEVWSMLED